MQQNGAVLTELFIIFRETVLKATTFNGVYRDKDGTDWENVLFLQAKTKAHKLLNDIYSVSSSE